MSQWIGCRREKFGVSAVGVAAALLGVAWAGQAGASAIVIEARATANAYDNSSLIDGGFGTTHGFGTHTYLASAGGSSARTTLDLEPSALRVTVEHARDGSFDARASSSATIDLSVTQNMAYAISGAYSVNDLNDADPGLAHQLMYLYEAGVGDRLYDHQVTTDVADPTLIIDGLDHPGAGGFGSLTGVLEAGRRYRLEYLVYTNAFPTQDGGATARGFVNLELSVVPEPSSSAVILVGWVLARRRRANPPA